MVLVKHVKVILFKLFKGVVSQVGGGGAGFR